MKITEEMIEKIASPVIYKRGVEYFEEGRIHLRSIEDNSVKALADDNEIYNISLTISDDKIENCFCTCQYFHTMGCNCKHIVATLKMCQREFDQTENIDNKNDKIARDLCNEFRNKNEEKTRINLRFSLNIYTSPQGCEFSLGLRAGTDVAENPVKAVSFIKNLYEEGVVSLSKHKKIPWELSEISTNDRKILDILAEIQASRRDDAGTSEDIYINDYTLSRIIPILDSVDYECRIDGMTFPDLQILEDDPDILLDITATNGKITLVINERGVALTKDGSWFLYEGNIYHTKADWQDWFMPIYKTVILSRRTQIDFDGSNAIDFVSHIYPRLKDKKGVILDGFDDVIIDKNPVFEVFIDNFGDGISAVPVVHYGTIALKPGQDIKVNDKILIRNTRLEKEVVEFFAGFEQAGDRYITNDNGVIFEFLTEKLPKLETYGQVYYNKKIKVSNQIPIKAKVGYMSDINLLEVGFESTLGSDEIIGILESISARMPFFRRKNGDFFQLDYEKLSLGDLVSSLGFSETEIKSGRKLLSQNNAFYLSGLSQTGLIESDAEFDRFIDGIKKTEIKIPEHIDKVLRGYQREGVRWLAQLSTYGFGGILADDMGLGKTLQVIAFVMSKKPGKPSLVVAPSSLTYNWQNEIQKFAPEAKSVIIEGTKAERSALLDEIDTCDFVITSYPLMRRDMELYRKKEFSYFFIDEAQYIKNPATINAKSVKKINAGGYFAITGTPVENSLGELWSIFDFLMKGYLYSQREFSKRFQNGIMKEEDKSKIEELRRKIQPFILRRMKKDVLKELPDKIENTIYTGLEPEQKNMYEAFLRYARNEVMYMTDKSRENRMKILSLLMRLRQICCHPRLFDSAFEGDSGKLQLFEETVTSAVEAGHRILVFSQFTSMLSIIKERLDSLGIRYFYLDGSTRSDERTELAAKFNRGEREVFLVSLKAGGTGLNLVGADMVIHYDPWWNPAVMDQASDRAHRIGQKKVVQVIKLAAKGTIEEQIIKLQKKKKELADDVIKENSSLLSNLTKEEILEIFS